MRAACALLLCLACSGDDRPVPPRGVQEVVVPVSDTITPTEVPPTRRRRGRSFGGSTPASPMGVAGAPAEAEAAEEPQRDFAAELRRIAGDPASCGELGLANGPITIRVGAVVTSRGVVTRSSVSGPIESEVRECLERRIGGGRFAAPVEDAPRRVTAEIRLEVAEAPSTTTVDGTPAWAVPGVAGAPIRGPGGRSIQPPSGMAIEGPSGTPIQEPTGIPIQGPTGTPIGGGY